MRYSSSHENYQYHGPRINLDDITKYSPITTRQMSLDLIRRAALFVCGQATSLEDAVMLTAMLGLTDRLTRE